MASQATQLTLVADIASVVRNRRALATGYSSRPMAVSDSSALADLYLAAYPKEVVEGRHAALEEIERSLLGEYGPIDFDSSPVIEHHGVVVANVMTVLDAPWPDVPQGPFIIEVMVHPDHRRQGLAEHAIQLAVASLGSASERHIALRVMSDNDGARSLYTKLAFEEWRRPT